MRRRRTRHYPSMRPPLALMVMSLLATHLDVLFAVEHGGAVLVSPRDVLGGSVRLRQGRYALLD